MERMRIPIPEGSVEVKPEGKLGRYFVMREPGKTGWTWVKNVMGSDGATYEVTPERIVITSHSTHDNLRDGSKSELFSSNRYFTELQEFYQELLALAESQETK